MEGISTLCPVCRGTIRPHSNWVGRCDSCGFWRSTLDSGAGADIGGIESLRRHNFFTLLNRVQPRLPTGPILEVGCARGWFIDEAARRGLACLAIEPEAALAAEVARRHPEIIQGFFPAACPPGRSFAAIIFNDVFEHLPEPAVALDLCRERLDPGGLLVINLPSCDGVFFRTARALAAVGLSGPFERLWQKGLPSPHLSYFSPSTLKRLAVAHGFEEIDSFCLDSLHVSGLWHRLRSTSSLTASAAMYLPLAALSLVCRLLPPDIHVSVFRSSP